MNYFKDLKEFFSVKNVFTIRNLTVMAMMMGLKFILAQFSITLTPTIKIVSFAYLPGAMVSILYGPVAGLIFGFAADTIGYIANPFGPYFPGYAISEMLANFFYAALMYKKGVTIKRIVFARILILITITFGLNYIWNVIMYGSTASLYFTNVRIINNLIQFPLHVMLINYMAKLCLYLDKQRFARG